MRPALDHVIVHARSPRRSAELVASVLGVEVLPDWGPFVRVATRNGVTLDYVRSEPPFTQQHCAFLVDDEAFDDGLRRLLDRGVATWADPFRQNAGSINHLHGGRGVYFDDPDGHLMELITAPYGPAPEAEGLA